MTTRVSVVIPTHDRRAILERTIASIAAQQHPLGSTEVIVVADGCADGTDEILLPPPLAGHVISQPACGPAAARNRGASLATGDLLLFLDDDVLAHPGLIAAHVHAHDSRSDPLIVIGDLPPALDRRRDLFGITLRGWWDAILERMRRPDHRFTYADVLSGNCSISAAAFRALGGFDERLRCHEDYDLGYRLLRAGGRIVFAPDAAGSHQERTDLRGALARKRAEGSGDVALARKHPQLWPALACAVDTRPISRRKRLLRKLALSAPAAGDRFEHAWRIYLAVLGRVRARHRWRALLDDLLWYWYWRGVGEALGGSALRAFRKSLGDTPAGTVADIDLSPGLREAMRAVDAMRAEGAILRYGSIHVGTISPQPWAEPLAGVHVRRLLRTRFAKPLARALAIAHAGERAAQPAGDALPDAPRKNCLL